MGFSLNRGVSSLASSGAISRNLSGYTDLMVDGAPSPHQSDTTLRWGPLGKGKITYAKTTF
ncbi:hypothetical protein EA136_24605 [Enterobacter hormaechei subsp. hoffmannii]|nr:hypothetical protein [Salmonella enterica subsp. enterica serovar Schwarzengrund]RLZ15034.1 hypothetical protein EA136_24605 [Enterobacter hormaechei subsp. hoffmannii]